MASQQSIDNLYMKFAHDVAALSYCQRKQVGAVIVNEPNVIYGFNGTLPGDENCCEDDEGKTKDDVIHAEENALLKAGLPITEGATLYVTCGPCNHCTGMIITAKIKRVVFGEIYSHHDEFINRLKGKGITVEQHCDTGNKTVWMGSKLGFITEEEFQDFVSKPIYPLIGYIGLSSDTTKPVKDSWHNTSEWWSNPKESFTSWEPILEKRTNGDGTVTFRYRMGEKMEEGLLNNELTLDFNFNYKIGPTT